MPNLPPVSGWVFEMPLHPPWDFDRQLRFASYIQWVAKQGRYTCN